MIKTGAYPFSFLPGLDPLQTLMQASAKSVGAVGLFANIDIGETEVRPSLKTVAAIGLRGDPSPGFKEVQPGLKEIGAVGFLAQLDNSELSVSGSQKSVGTIGFLSDPQREIPGQIGNLKLGGAGANGLSANIEREQQFQWTVQDDADEPWSEVA